MSDAIVDRIEWIVNSFNRQVCEERDELKRKCRELQSIIDTHDLCHDLEGKVGRNEFEEGCRRKTIEVFGSCGWAEELAMLRERVAAIEERVSRAEIGPALIGGCE